VLASLVSVTSAAGRPTLSVARNAALHRQVLVDTAGRTLYMFTLDPRNGSICTARSPVPDCSKVWPPLLVRGKPVVGAGLDPAKVGTVKRDDGRLQVTYSGHALYRFAGYPPTPGDTKPGDAHGQAFEESWYVVGPTGRPIEKP
jgi:predicted lipoprotein with Yx(FWY)xxD motif